MKKKVRSKILIKIKRKVICPFCKEGFYGSQTFYAHLEFCDARKNWVESN